MAQEEIYFKSGTVKVSELIDLPSPQEGEILCEDSYFRLLVFSTIPTTEEKARLKELGITLLDYLPRNTFFASIKAHSDLSILDRAQILKIAAVLPEYKTSEMLTRNEVPHWSVYGVDQVEIIASYYGNISAETALGAMESIRHEVLFMRNTQYAIGLRVYIDDLPRLYALSCFRFFETTDPPGEPENLPGRTDHRSNTLWTEYSGGLTFRGDGVKVMMQDDGYIGEHIDYTGRIDQSNCSFCSSNDDDNHGDHVGGTIMGAGNLDPRARGMAHGVELLVYNSSNTNYNLVPALYSNDSVYITSKSYSDACNGGYTTLTQQLDQQVRQNPSLIHVFSAGNNGTSDCSYGAGAGWGNITGGHKSGKNVIAVGNLTSFDGLSSSSSRGPATDGRIKPDICAVGTNVNSTISVNNYASFTGTSMSCPGTAGTIAQLFEAYRALNSGENPNAALMKATVLNTADELGNDGPDFKHGWGRINARRAYELLESAQYMEDSVSQGGQNIHNITVPAGTKEVRIMVYWTDYEGSTSSAMALVNDINMFVTDPTAVDFDPWVLDPSPNATLLDAPAVRAIDNLNNVEQVTIDDPVDGLYTITVDGFAIPQGPQKYYLVYYFLDDAITVTYPIGGEGLEPQTNETIRWDASDGIDPFTVSFSEDDGISWTVLGTAPATQRYLNWSIPNGTLTGLGRIKVERGTSEDISDAVFSVVDIPNNLNINWSCPDSAQLIWDSVPGALSYEVSMLGAKYMDSIGTTVLNAFTVQIPSTSTAWFSVKALGPDNAIGERAIAIEKGTGEFGCLWSAPYADFSVECSDAGTNYCFALNDESINTDASTNFTWYFPGGNPAVSNDQFPTVCYPLAGDYDVAMVVDNGAGSDSIYMSNVFHVIGSPGLPYFEGFENYSTFVGLEEWSVENPDANGTFVISSTAALSGVKSARLMNYGQNGNFTDELISGPIDLSSLDPLNDEMTLSFRYSYRKRFTTNDEWLKVFVTAGCTDPWVQRKTIHGDQLSNIVQSSSWSPTLESDWTTVHMTNVTSNYFSSDFRMKFTFESDNGNNFYLDNINLYEGAPSEDIVGQEDVELSELSLFPNPVSEELNIQFSQNSDANIEVRITDLFGKTVFARTVLSKAGNNLVVVNTEGLSSGMYLLSLEQNSNVTTRRFIVK